MADMSIERVETAEGEGVLSLKVAGSVTIAGAADFREALLGALREANGVQVDLSTAEDFDLTALQLLCAAHGSAQAAGKSFGVIDGGNEVYQDTVTKAGFQRHIGCARDVSGTCIWLGGES